VFLVIFRARTASLDDEYGRVAERMRHLARERYGCLEFLSATAGDEEIAISYWETEAQIEAWKRDPEHLAAQEAGKSGWYEWYKVQVAEIVREYEGGE